MDIDSPPSNSYDDLPLSPAQHAGHSHINLPHFSASFPLPFRVLTLVGLEILLWAVNLHVLTILGVDAGGALDLSQDIENEQDGGDVNNNVNDGSLSLTDEEEDEEKPRVLFDGDHNNEPELPASRIIRLDSPSPSTPSFLPPTTSSRRPSRRTRRRTDLHKPIYMLFVIYTLWVGMGWTAFRYATGQAEGGEEEVEMDRFRWVIGVIVGGLVVGLTWKRGFLARSERMGLLRSLKRILSPPWDHAPFFADVILADVLTSFAKVLGDLVVSSNQIWSGGLAQGRVRMSGTGNYIKLAMVCLPYCLRLRQCIQEYLIPHQTSSRPLFNALKYASAFPVIFLSAAQRNVMKEIAEIKGLSVEVLEKQMHESQSRWFGESRTFRLWLLAVLINSLFSFWWDVSNDWGLGILQSSTWFKAPVTSYSARTTPDSRANIVYRNFRRLVRSVAASLGFGTDSGLAAEEFELGPHRRSPFPSPGLGGSTQLPGNPDRGDHHAPHLHPTSRSGSSSAPFAGAGPTGPFGLRPRMLFPDPFVYYLFILLDLVLRFTWSLKLSSHLHTISEIESGVFIMEALELGRRWMWVFLRVEWEEVKRLDARAQERRYEMEEARRVGINGSTQVNGLGLGLLHQVDHKAPIVR